MRRNATLALAPSRSTTDFWRFIVMDVCTSNVELKRLESNQEAEENFKSDMNALLTGLQPKMLIDAVKNSLWNTSFCLTTKDDLVLVQGPAGLGDNIFITLGATMPFILRPTQSDETYMAVKRTFSISSFYKLVGGAYIHGIMNGQPLADMEGNGLSDETVYLI